MELTTATSLIKHASLSVLHPATWADLGCGDGFFTKALSTFLVEGSTIYAVDNNAQALKNVKLFKGITPKPIQLNFVKDGWPFEKLDGIIMANSLHYVKHQQIFLHKVKRHLKDGGILLIVEYDIDKANPWVPYPVSFAALQKLCTVAGLGAILKLNEAPSAFGRTNMYAAISMHKQ